MQLRSKPSSPPSPRLLVFLAATVCIYNVSAQGLPALTSGNGDSSPSTTAAASSGAASTASATFSDPDSGNSAAATTTGGNGPPKLPSISGVYSYPPPSVPPTADAPYMQHSNLPEGTIFIAVGAALGFFGFVVLLWRAMVAWSINRSVKKAAMAQMYGQDRKRRRRRSHRKGGGLPYDPNGSSMSLEKLNGSGGKAPPITSTHAPSSSLFFSPTAGAGMHTPAHRSSGYLPAGYYATGTPAPSGTTSIGGRPKSQGYMRTNSEGPSPPPSPGLPSSRGTDGRPPSEFMSSSVNISLPSQNGRAPSMVLDDMFESHAPKR